MLKMDKEEFDEAYENQTLENVIYRIECFRDLDLPKIRGGVSRGYWHTPEEDVHRTIRFLKAGIKKGYNTFGEIKEDKSYEYKTIKSWMNNLHDQWRFPL
jgi:hypothetical protein